MGFPRSHGKGHLHRLGTMWSSQLHGAVKVGYLSSGVVDASHGTSNGIFQVGVLYFTGSQEVFLEPVRYREIWHMPHPP